MFIKCCILMNKLQNSKVILSFRQNKTTKKEEAFISFQKYSFFIITFSPSKLSDV